MAINPHPNPSGLTPVSTTDSTNFLHSGGSVAEKQRHTVHPVHGKGACKKVEVLFDFCRENLQRNKTRNSKRRESENNGHRSGHKKSTLREVQRVIGGPG